MAQAIKNPRNYVMKPQKEGGGNNFFDEDIPILLNKIIYNPEQAGELLTYLIMERINPPMLKFLCIKNGEIKVCEGLSELGIFSSVFTNTKNKQKSEVLS